MTCLEEIMMDMINIHNKDVEEINNMMMNQNQITIITIDIHLTLIHIKKH